MWGNYSQRTDGGSGLLLRPTARVSSSSSSSTSPPAASNDANKASASAEAGGGSRRGSSADSPQQGAHRRHSGQRLDEEGRIENALEAYHRQQRPNIFRAPGLISALGKRRGDRDLDKALGVYDALIASGQRPDVVVINALIDACRRCGQPGRELGRLLDDVNRFDVRLNAFAIHLMTASCGAAGDWKSGKRLLAMMQQGQLVGFVPDDVDCLNLTKALVANERLRDGIADAFSLLDLMDQWTVQPRLQLFSLLVAACGESREPMLIRQVHRRINQTKLDIDMMLARALISAYSKSPDYIDDAVTVYKAYIASGQRPDATIIGTVVNACRRCDEPSKALPWILDDIEKYSVSLDKLSFSILAAACGEAGDWKSGGRLLEKLQQGRLGFSPNNVDCGQLAKALVANKRLNDGIAEAFSLLELMDKWTIRPDSALFAQLVAACGESGDIRLIRQVHRRIDQCKLNSDANLTRALISAYSKCPEGLENSISIYKTFVADGHSPDSTTIGTVVNACRQCGEPGKALPWILDDIEQYSVSLDKLSFSILAAACGEAGDQKSAGRLLGKLQQGKLRFIPTVVDCGQLAKAMIDKTSNDSLTNVLPLLDFMDQSGIEPSSAFFTILLMACSYSSSVKIGRQLHARILSTTTNEGEPMIKAGLVRAALINMYSQCGFLADAEAVFADMGHPPRHTINNTDKLPATTTTAAAIETFIGGSTQQGYSDHQLPRHPNPESSSREDGCTTTAPSGPGRSGAWSAMINAYGMHGQARKALDLFNQMRQSNDTVDDITITAVLNACSHGGLADEALSIFDSLLGGGFAPVEATAVHLTCMVALLGRADRLDEAEQLMATTVASTNIKPNQVMVRALLGACWKHNDVVRAKCIFERCQADWIPSAPDYVLLSNIYAQGGLIEESKSIRQKMKDQGLKKIPGISWIDDADGTQHTFYVEDRNHPRVNEIRALLDRLWEQMKEIGFAPDRTVVTHPRLLTSLHHRGEQKHTTDGHDQNYMDDDQDNEAKDCHLKQHSEKLAIAYGLLTTQERSTLRVFKNLRVCRNCHEATKYIAKVTQREIIVRDANRFHHFMPNGRCLCGDYW